MNPLSLTSQVYAFPEAQGTSRQKRARDPDDEDLYVNKSGRHPKNVSKLQHFMKLLPSVLLEGAHGKNPRAIAEVGRREQLIAQLYDDYRRVQGAMLREGEIPSHVSAAHAERAMAFLDRFSPGTLLYQQTRPEGWLGDYYSGDPNELPSRLGFSEKVTASDGSNTVVPRVKIKAVVISGAGVRGVISTARACQDTWSIQGQSITCHGGAQQLYMPLTPAAKQKALVILKEGSDDEQLRIQAVAQKNKVPCLTEEELRQNHGIELKSLYRIEPLESNVSTLTALELQRRVIESFTLGSDCKGIDYLNTLVERPVFSAKKRNILEAILGCWYASVGRVNDAADKLNAFITFYESSVDNGFKLKYREIYLQSRHHLALSSGNAEEAIKALTRLLEDIKANQVPYTHLGLLYLDLGIRYNQLASRYSDEVTYHDFDDEGRLTKSKEVWAKQAQECIEKSQTFPMGPAEQIIALTELGYSFRKQRSPIDGAQKLYEALKMLVNYRQELSSPNLDKELDLQQTGIELGLGLSLARCRDKNALPPHLKAINHDDLLENVTHKLEQLSIMTIRWLFFRWVGESCNDLFKSGWISQKDKDSEHGTGLIGLYRKYHPLELGKICSDLRDNTILDLELSYLGEEQPTGVSDQAFRELVASLAENRSLKRLYLRKFSNKVPADSTAPYHRAQALFDALLRAQHKGQRLQYLSYSGARFNNEEDHQAALTYLRENHSLRILQPALYDWKETAQIEAFAETIKRHPTLTTLLTQMVRAKDGGQIIGQACAAAAQLKYVYPFPGHFQSYNEEEKKNNDVLERVAKELLESDPVME